jgi:hypothetical protein
MLPPATLRSVAQTTTTRNGTGPARAPIAPYLAMAPELPYLIILGNIGVSPYTSNNMRSVPRWHHEQITCLHRRNAFVASCPHASRTTFRTVSKNGHVFFILTDFFKIYMSLPLPRR